MRISDWSSDVCSSDLSLAAISVSRSSVPFASSTSPAKITDCGDCGRLTRKMRCCAAGVGTAKFFLPFMSRVRRQRPKLFSSRSEERRVGKGVSVLVDLGGGRSHQKKKEITKKKA